MKANSFSQYFGITTFGESHNFAMGVVIDDVSAGIDFPFEELREALAKRRPGQFEFSSARNEPDDFEVISGIFEGKTTGMPICILFKNIDHRSDDYDDLKGIFRPGQSDYGLWKKFKIYDYRGGGRLSGRETISRVAAGAVVKRVLGDIKIQVYPVQIGTVKATKTDFAFMESNPLRWADPETYAQAMNYLKSTKDEKDSTGAIVQANISNIPAGLGDPVFEKLDANLAKAIISIGGIKGIEFGDGFKLCEMKGSEANEVSRAGGIVGGITNGKDINLTIAIKPVPSIEKPQKALNKEMQETVISISGRHDVCLVPRILPVIESMIQLVLADAIAYQDLISIEKKDLTKYREAIDKIDEDILIALYRRGEIVRLIGEFKKEHNLPIFAPDREKQLLDDLSQKAQRWGISPALVQQVWEIILKESKRVQG